MSGLRRGFSAAEFIVFTAMSIFLITAGYELLRNATVVGSTTEKGLELQQGMRNLLENLVKDVNASAFIAEPNGSTQLPAHKIVLWVFDDDKEAGDDSLVQPGKRLLLNGGPDSPGLVGSRNPYPFFHDQNPTKWGLPVIQVTYDWNPTAKVVTRKAERGAVVMETLQKGKPFVDKFSFQARPGALAGSPLRKMCDNVEQIDAFPFGYNELKLDPATQYGELKPTAELPDIVTGMAASTAPVLAGFTGFGGGGAGGTVGTGPRIARTAMLLVKLKARFDYVSAKYRDPEVFVATKIWSYARLSDHVYQPYFSSVDDDLRY